MPCRGSDDGCGWNGKRAEQAAHESSCLTLILARQKKELRQEILQELGQQIGQQVGQHMQGVTSALEGLQAQMKQLQPASYLSALLSTRDASDSDDEEEPQCHETEIVQMTLAGTKLITVAYKVIKVWDVESGTLLASLRGHDRAVRPLAVSESKLFSGDGDWKIIAWDLNTYQRLSTMEGNTDCVRESAANGTKLFSGSRDGSVFAWTTDTYQLLSLDGKHPNRIGALAVHNSKLFSACIDVIQIHDTQSYQLMATLDITFVKRLHAVDDKVFVVGIGGRLSVLDPQSHDTTIITSTEGYSIERVWVAGSKMFTSGDEGILAWDRETFELLSTVEASASDAVTEVPFIAASDRHLVSMRNDDDQMPVEVTVRNLDSLATVKTFPVRLPDESALAARQAQQDRARAVTAARSRVLS